MFLIYVRSFLGLEIAAINSEAVFGCRKDVSTAVTRGRTFNAQDEPAAVAVRTYFKTAVLNSGFSASSCCRILRS
jgi:hypothetical protein